MASGASDSARTPARRRTSVSNRDTQLEAAIAEIKQMLENWSDTIQREPPPLSTALGRQALTA